MKKIVWLLLSVCALPALAQEFGEEGEIEDTEVIVEKDRQIELPRANRNFKKIVFDVAPPEPPPQQFDLRTFDLDLPPVDPRLRALTTKPDPLDKLYGNYVRGGVGNYATTYLEGHFGSKRARDYAYGARFRHLASARGPVDGRNSGSGENALTLYGQRFGQQHALGARLGYDRQRYHFYGYDTDGETPERDSIEQTFHTVALEATLRRRNPEAAFYYDATLGYRLLSDAYQAREGEFGGRAEARYALGGGSNVVVSSDLALTRRTDSATVGRSLFALRPAYQWQPTDAFTVRAGLNLAYENDTIGERDLHLYPAAEVAYAVRPGATVFGGLGGDMEKNTLGTFVEENPFLAPDVLLLHANRALEVYGGVRGQAADRWTYQARLAYQQYCQLPFFVNSFPDSSRFDIVYDDATVLNLTLQGSYAASESFGADARVVYNGYRPDDLAEAWHRPAWQVGLGGRYTWREKIVGRADLNYNSRILAPDPNDRSAESPTAITLDGLFDLDLSAEYLFSERASAFLRLDNVISQQNPRFLYYPTRGLLVMIGGTYAF